MYSIELEFDIEGVSEPETKVQFDVEFMEEDEEQTMEVKGT